MLFEKNSTRTRFSFDAAMRQLGGAAIITNAGDTQLGRGEPVEDTARVLSRMVDAVMIRAVDHEDVERFAQAASVPVINGLTDKSHPCQILADLMTVEEALGRPVSGMTFAWVGERQQRVRQPDPCRGPVRFRPAASPAPPTTTPTCATCRGEMPAGA